MARVDDDDDGQTELQVRVRELRNSNASRSRDRAKAIICWEFWVVTATRPASIATSSSTSTVDLAGVDNILELSSQTARGTLLRPKLYFSLSGPLFDFSREILHFAGSISETLARL